MNPQAGMTLTELMVVMTIVGILMGIGVPSYRYVTTANRVSSEANALLADLHYARSEAIREGQTVAVCASTDGASCTGGVDDTWQGGWIVFSDANGDQSVQAASEPVLRVMNKFSGQDTFTSTVNVVSFNREGFAIGLPNAGLTMTLHEHTGNIGYSRCLQINMVGTVKVVSHAKVAACT